MQRIVSVAATLLLAGTVAVAQNGYGSRQAASNDGQQRGSIEQAMDQQQDSSMTGCLRLADGTYWLSTDKGKSYRLSGDRDALARLAGHQVRIAGDRGKDNSFAVTRASDMASTCTRASEPVGTRIQNTPFQGSQGGTWGPPENWHRGNTGKGVAQTAPPAKDRAKDEHRGNSSDVQQNGGIAAPSNPYERHPAQVERDRNMPSEPLSHARPEDQTPSVGTSAQQGANMSGQATEQSGSAARHATTARHSRHNRKVKKSGAEHNGSHTNPPSSTTPPPQF